MAIIGTGLLEARSVLDEVPPPHAPAWLNDAKSVVEAAIGENEIPYLTPEYAFQLYKGIYGQIVAQLKQMGRNARRRPGTVDGTEEYSLAEMSNVNPRFQSFLRCIGLLFCF